jgi:hypothetical protein
VRDALDRGVRPVSCGERNAHPSRAHHARSRSSAQSVPLLVTMDLEVARDHDLEEQRAVLDVLRADSRTHSDSSSWSIRRSVLRTAGKRWRGRPTEAEPPDERGHAVRHRRALSCSQTPSVERLSSLSCASEPEFRPHGEGRSRHRRLAWDRSRGGSRALRRRCGRGDQLSSICHHARRRGRARRGRWS